MNKMTIREMIEVLHGAEMPENRYSIQWQHNNTDYYTKEWGDIDDALEIEWNFGNYRFRVKPEPREFLLVRNDPDKGWLVTEERTYEDIRRFWRYYIKVREVLE